MLEQTGLTTGSRASSGKSVAWHCSVAVDVAAEDVDDEDENGGRNRNSPNAGQSKLSVGMT